MRLRQFLSQRYNALTLPERSRARLGFARARQRQCRNDITPAEFHFGQIFIAKMRKANDGANEHEKDSELGVHVTPLHYISRPHWLFVTTFLSAVIDEDQT